MKLRNCLAAWGLALLLAGCAGPQIYHHQLVLLDQGMTPEAVVERLKQAPRSAHATRVDASNYYIQSYVLNNGMGADVYLIAYEEGRLRYWGYIDDFRRHPDSRLGRAANQVLPGVFAALQKK